MAHPERHEPSLLTNVPFIVWQAHLPAFFTGPLSFISGYFAERSLSRRGAGSFVRERLVRLGLPRLFYMLVIHPFIPVGLNSWHHDFGPAPAFYANFLRSGHIWGASGLLWFALALLVFCLGLAATRRPAAPTPISPPPSRAVRDPLSRNMANGLNPHPSHAQVRKFFGPQNSPSADTGFTEVNH